jgi:hypothetical protein
MGCSSVKVGYPNFDFDLNECDLSGGFGLGDGSGGFGLGKAPDLSWRKGAPRPRSRSS